MNAQEIVAVVEAFLNGKKIQFRCKNTTDPWCSIGTPTWDFPHNDYRVKPEPVVAYANVYENGVVNFHLTEKSASGWRTTPGCLRTIKLVEAEDVWTNTTENNEYTQEQT